jgi:hypothetical protein
LVYCVKKNLATQVSSQFFFFNKKKSFDGCTRRSDHQGDQTSLRKKIAQNVAQPIFVSKLTHNLNRGKSGQKCGLPTVIFLELPNVCEQSTNGRISGHPVVHPDTSIVVSPASNVPQTSASGGQCYELKRFGSKFTSYDTKMLLPICAQKNNLSVAIQNNCHFLLKIGRFSEISDQNIDPWSSSSRT